MKILLLGKNGQVGHAIYDRLMSSYEVIATDRNQCDFRDEDRIEAYVMLTKPDLIINAVAYTDVDLAEDHQSEVFQVNATTPGLLAKKAHALNIPLIYFSTEAVFDGKKNSAYTEDDVPHPLSVYGKSKCEGENLIRLHHSKHFILRTSWVFSSYGDNFIKKIIKLANERDKLSVISDQYGAPTSAEWIAKFVSILVEKIKFGECEKLYGTYHITLEGNISWLDYAQFILLTLQDLNISTKLKPDHIMPIALHEYPQKAQRPFHSRLDLTKAKKTFMLEFPHWKNEVKHAIHLIMQS